MKQIATWKVVLLTIVTFGIYAIFWAARNRDYLAKHDKKAKLPRWLWLVAFPIAYGLFYTACIAAGILAGLMVISADAAIMTMRVSGATVLILTVLLGSWWVWHFGTAMQKYLKSPVTRGWAVVLFIFIGPFVASFYQYFINKKSEVEGEGASRPSVGFVLLAVSLILLSLVSAFSTILTYKETEDSLRVEITTIQNNTKAANAVYENYLRCAAQLEVDYPGALTTDNEAAYNADLQKCNELYDKYIETLDAY